MADLHDKLTEYAKSDMYPFHMPGHKRRVEAEYSPYDIDITEIDGFDNLHNPKDIIKRSMDKVHEFYESDRTYFLINGSTCGLLSAICGTTKRGDNILVARNCHKSVYNAIYLNELRATYLYPELIPDGSDAYAKSGQYGMNTLNGGISPSQVEKALKENDRIKVIVITSPTYEGITSDIKVISDIAHDHGAILIVDEAHGAHYDMHAFFPQSALSQGADIVIQSIHKTLAALTQTALLHIRSKRVDTANVEKYLHIYQTSSPSYVLMSSIDRCMDEVMNQGALLFEKHVRMVEKFIDDCSKFTHIGLLDYNLKRKYAVCDIDRTRLVIFSKSSKIDGRELYKRLLNRYHLQMEMAQAGYVVAITSYMDTKEGFERLYDALTEIDRELRLGVNMNKAAAAYSGGKPVKISYAREPITPRTQTLYTYPSEPAIVQNTVCEAERMTHERSVIEASSGKISADYVYLYPPGTPIIVPGELITNKICDAIADYIKLGFEVNGLIEEDGKRYINVVKETFVRKSIMDFFGNKVYSEIPPEDRLL